MAWLVDEQLLSVGLWTKRISTRFWRAYAHFDAILGVFRKHATICRS